VAWYLAQIGAANIREWDKPLKGPFQKQTATAAARPASELVKWCYTTSGFHQTETLACVQQSCYSTPFKKWQAVPDTQTSGLLIGDLGQPKTAKDVRAELT